MSILAVGVSHRTAPVDLLERVSIASADLPKALHELRSADHVGEALVLSTCNRVEVYAHVGRFHGGVAQVSDLLSRVSGVPLEDLADHLYVHYEDRAVHHVFSVAAGLDSMVVGESEILGQLRTAFEVASAEKATGRVIGELCRHALRVGKRARTETGIGRAGASLVEAGVRMAGAAIGGLDGRASLVVGAGGIARLAAATLRKAGTASVLVANRTTAHADDVAAAVDGRSVALDDLDTALAGVDIVVSCTGATGTVIPYEVVERAMATRPTRPLFLLDLAMPRDVDPGVGAIAGVTVADLDALRPALDATGEPVGVDAARRMVGEEVAVFLAWQGAMRVAPTVVALRTKADELVASELVRLGTRLPGLGAREAAEVESAVRRVVDKLLHAPTVRIKELADSPGGDLYAEALRELFELDPQVPEAVSAPEVEPTPVEGGGTR